VSGKKVEQFQEGMNKAMAMARQHQMPIPMFHQFPHKWLQPTQIYKVPFTVTCYHLLKRKAFNDHFLPEANDNHDRLRTGCFSSGDFS